MSHKQGSEGENREMGNDIVDFGLLVWNYKIVDFSYVLRC